MLEFLFEALGKRLGRERVFRDTRGIFAGEDFAAVIDQTLSKCGGIVVVIGPRWLGAPDPAGRRRLDDPTDLHRKEIEFALQRGLPVFPVLVEQAAIPSKGDLPDSLKSLAGKAARTVSDNGFDDDVRRLATDIEKAMRARPRNSEGQTDRDTRPSRLRALSTWALAVALGLVVAVVAPRVRERLEPAPLGPAAVRDLVVLARPDSWKDDVLTDTGLRVTKGSTLRFSASGAWDVGLGTVGPDGTVANCECLVSDGSHGPLGALVGRIGRTGPPFLIGANGTIVAHTDGVLYLGSNDNMGPCDGAIRGSCYDDNRGALKVHLETIAAVAALPGPTPQPPPPGALEIRVVLVGPPAQFLVRGPSDGPRGGKSLWVGVRSGLHFWPLAELLPNRAVGKGFEYRITAPADLKSGDVVVVEVGPTSAKLFVDRVTGVVGESSLDWSLLDDATEKARKHWP